MDSFGKSSKCWDCDELENIYPALRGEQWGYSTWGPDSTDHLFYSKRNMKSVLSYEASCYWHLINIKKDTMQAKPNTSAEVGFGLWATTNL